MSIYENLQGLSLDTKGLLAALVICWLLLEVRHGVRRRADALIIQRLRLALTGGDRAFLETEAPTGRAQGAALAAGKAVTRGHEAGQYFSTVVQNSGVLAAEDIQVTAAFGSHKVRVLTAPSGLQVSTRVAPIELRLPFGLLSFDETQRHLLAGVPLRLQIAYRDASKNAHLLEECFTFARPSAERDDRHVPWTSQRSTCPS